MEGIMSTLLYIKASPMGELSYSIAVADAFLEEYRKAHPEDNVRAMNLFTEPLPAFDFEAASAKYKIMHGKDHIDKDKQIWAKIISVIDDFKSADKYIIATPMWNFSIPYRLKQYIDILVQPGYTFTVAKDGNYKGLVTNKPVFVAYARGGEYPAGTPQEAFDLQKKYIELILAFIGLTDIRSVIVEPTLAGAEIATRKRSEAIEKAREIAREF
jgi:FMN-dependent NADH-azoreductase